LEIDKYNFADLLAEIPMEYVMASEKIINFAKIKLGKKLNEIIYVNVFNCIYYKNCKKFII